MANDITGPHLWELDTVATLKAVGTKVFVRKVIYKPAVAADDLIIQEYDSSGTLKDAIVLKAGASDIDWLHLDFGPDCLEMNGFRLATIDGGTVFVYVKTYQSAG